MDSETIMMILAVLGGFIGVGGWLSAREKTLKQDAQWRGRIDGKLDMLMELKPQITRIEQQMQQTGKALAVHEREITALKEKNREQRMIS